MHPSIIIISVNLFMGKKGIYINQDGSSLVACPAHAGFLVRNGLVNEVQFLGLTTQEPMRLRDEGLLHSTSLTTVKFVHLHLSTRSVLSGFSAKCFEHLLGYTVH